VCGRCAILEDKMFFLLLVLGPRSINLVLRDITSGRLVRVRDYIFNYHVIIYSVLNYIVNKVIRSTNKCISESSKTYTFPKNCGSL
jgi:hypothetical protein